MRTLSKVVVCTSRSRSNLGEFYSRSYPQWPYGSLREGRGRVAERTHDLSMLNKTHFPCFGWVSMCYMLPNAPTCARTRYSNDNMWLITSTCYTRCVCFNFTQFGELHFNLDVDRMTETTGWCGDKAAIQDRQWGRVPCTVFLVSCSRLHRQ